jgi:hypothetical protein
MTGVVQEKTDSGNQKQVGDGKNLPRVIWFDLFGFGLIFAEDLLLNHPTGA